MQNFLENHLIFKRELPDTPVFTETEEKLIRLGLNEAAHQGESDACAVKLFQSLRRRGVSAEQVIAHMTESTWAMRDLMAARGRVVDFGKYRGKTVGEVPPDYLEWALRECSNLSFNLRRAMQLVLDART
jgi:uncharacterized protein (DUF3820 family)